MESPRCQSIYSINCVELEVCESYKQTEIVQESQVSLSTINQAYKIVHIFFSRICKLQVLQYLPFLDNKGNGEVYIKIPVYTTSIDSIMTSIPNHPVLDINFPLDHLIKSLNVVFNNNN